MAALVQTYPQQTSTITMLQTRPSSSSGPFQTGSQTQQRASQMARNMYNGGNTTSYRGQTSMAPMAPTAPYAFTTTPSLANGTNTPRQHTTTTPHLRQETRALSAPVLPSSQQSNGFNNQSRQRQLASSPNIIDTSDLNLNDESSQKISAGQRSLDLTLSDPRLIAGNSLKPSPDRYRRNHRRSETSSAAFGSPASGGSALPSGSGMATVGHLYNHPSQSMSSPAFASNPMMKASSKDDSVIGRQSTDQAKRYRRKSTLGNDEPSSHSVELRMQAPPPRTYASVVSTPYTPERQEVQPMQTNTRHETLHGRSGSDDSISSSRSTSRPSSSKREATNIGGPVSPTVVHGTSILKNEAKLVHIPPRGSSDASKRLTNPSPLSKPMDMMPESPVSQSSFAKLVQAKTSSSEPPMSAASIAQIPESPAAQHLAALNKKDAKKEGKSSRLRRAFSFGSAAELRKASAENSHNSNVAAERTRLRKERYNDEEEARQAAIVQQQEASGLGEGIYSGQGHFFTGSTDNLSISSTASSASIMLRKMGKGVKKSTRSLVGLFRPKSVIGVPAADAALPEPSVAQVSIVTVEAEREKVNVNLNPHDQAGGGTGFPKLERNSLDTASIGTSEPSLSFSDRSSDNVKPRRSIVGGEKERTEVLAAVKKGILKRSGTDSGNSSPHTRPADVKTTDFTLPQLPRFADSPHSSAPSTPTDDHTPRGHRRTDSVTIEGEDYFMSVARFAGSEAKSLPGTPRSITGRNISFSPRIQFHDTWPSGEYDRRGEIATCNRLTPTLAQAIKEELNTFKMEMEVHESSKVYTHFF